MKAQRSRPVYPVTQQSPEAKSAGATEEYKMLRDEILAYMDKLQVVRNMMIVSVCAVLAFSAKVDLPADIGLTPAARIDLALLQALSFDYIVLALVLTFFRNAVDYWICVRKACAYQMVFLESDPACAFRWETRHQVYKDTKATAAARTAHKSAFFDIASQLSCYCVCAAIGSLGMLYHLFQAAACELIAGGRAVTVDALLSTDVFGLSSRWLVAIWCVTVAFTVVYLQRASCGPSFADFYEQYQELKQQEERENARQSCGTDATDGAPTGGAQENGGDQMD